MSSQTTTNHYSNFPAPVYNFTDVVGISILDTEDKTKGKENTILDFIRECNRQKEERLRNNKVEISKS